MPRTRFAIKVQIGGEPLPIRDPVLRREYHRNWYAMNREKVIAWNGAWRRANPKASRAMQRHADYGITQAEYDAMLAEQGGRCAVCGFDRPLVIDHNHA